MNVRNTATHGAHLPSATIGKETQREFWQTFPSKIIRADEIGRSTAAYLESQKTFWNADEETSKFSRVDTVSRTQDEYDRLADQHFRSIFADVSVKSDWTVLEIGCGVGRLLSRLMSNTSARKVIGIDISESMIAHARSALGEKENLFLAVNSGDDLGVIPDRSVDFIYSNDVFIHIHDLEVVKKYLSEVRRVLKANGSFKFNVRRMNTAEMFSNSPGGLIAKLSYALNLQSPLHRTNPMSGFSGIEYRERDIRYLVTRAGMEVTKILTDNNYGRLWCACCPK